MVSPTLVLILITVLYCGTTAQSECIKALTSLSSCLDYLAGGSSSPTKNCCSQLSKVVQSSPKCLCLIVNSNETSFSGLSFLNRTLALNLPMSCNVQTPSLSLCKEPTISSPKSAPSPSYGSNEPTTSPTNNSTGSPQSNETESKTLPRSNESSSSNTNMIVSLLFVALLLAKHMSFTLFIV